VQDRFSRLASDSISAPVERVYNIEKDKDHIVVLQVTILFLIFIVHTSNKSFPQVLSIWKHVLFGIQPFKTNVE
jgi:hypothetical protein